MLKPLFGGPLSVYSHSQPYLGEGVMLATACDVSGVSPVCLSPVLLVFGEGGGCGLLPVYGAFLPSLLEPWGFVLGLLPLLCPLHSLLHS